MNIVLAHGILGFEKLLGIDYFNGVKEHLTNKFQARVLVTKVDPVKSVKFRAAELKRKTLAALDKTGVPPVLDPNEKVHIIAHSMGGLDSRFILSSQNPDNIANKVNSLTTIGTPHKGSPVADLVVSLVDGQAPMPAIGTIELKVKEAFEKAGLSLDGVRDLTTTSADNFNRNVIDNPAIK